MVQRTFWQRRIESAWARRSVVWLTGVRRVGKTMLCQSLPSVEYIDCERPRERQRLQDVEAFLSQVRGKRVVLDEVHRLPNPSEVLKLAADHFPETRIVATGSSTLSASGRFRDTLTGRKIDVWLTPMTQDDLAAFGQPDLVRRLAQGGLPPFFLAEAAADADAYQEWIDSYWSKDVQALFRLERRWGFERLLELLFGSSGGIFEATQYAAPSEISRGTVMNYLSVLEATHVAHVVRPFSARLATEIVAAPKVYLFDTGFVRYFRGWGELRPDDLGVLWEHYILNELQAHVEPRAIGYWRDKRGHEIDLILSRRGFPPIAIECKWRASSWSPDALRAFRLRHPKGDNWVVARDVDLPYKRAVGHLEVEFIEVGELIGRLEPEHHIRPTWSTS